MPQTETRLGPLALIWLEQNGQGTAPQIAREIGRDPGLVNATLRKYEAAGHVRRVGTEPNPLGRASVIYERVIEEDEMHEHLRDGMEARDQRLAPVDGETPPVEAIRDDFNGAHETPPGAPGAANGRPLLSAEELEELVGGYCVDVKLADAAAQTLRTALAVREAIEQLEADEDPAPMPTATLEELLEVYCGTITVSEAEATTLRFVLKVREVIEAASAG
jgi:DNA-binding Lrp family transcriptional regulator